jgi:hypothetical protein
MRVEIARRLLVIALSVALSAGLVLRSAQAIAMDTMAPPAAAAAATPDAMPMPGKCDGCPGQEKAMAACSAFCANVSALLPAVIELVPIAVETVGPRVEASASGHVFPPDPYPPKPSILS